MHKETVLHVCDSSYAYAVDDHRMVFKLRTKKNDMKTVSLYYGDKYDDRMLHNIKLVPMELAFSDALHDYFEVEVELDYNRLAYCFLLDDGVEQLIYAQESFVTTDRLDKNRMFLFPYICREDIYRSDRAWEELVVYQIFVDRFHKIDKDESWNRLPGVSDIYGGNLAGIIDKLDYLQELGVNCIYLTPIFEAPTNHKYNTINYYSVDNAFGDESVLRELIDSCHDLGIKVILDAVFNHTSDHFFAFKDIKRRGKSSKYYNWYFVEDDMQYETFGYAKGMPKLNTGNKEVSDYLIEIGKYWIREFDIDGWRLDVANEIDHKFWRRFREEIKGIKQEAIIIGEVWDFGESYLQGDQYDSIMNYPFMNAALEFFARKSVDAASFDHLINNVFARYKKGTRGLLLNLIGSHDTSRFVYECGEDIERLKLAAFFQMTSLGIPMIYYGDEAGLTGKGDPDCRRTIDFEHLNEQLFHFYRGMIVLRKNSDALAHGQFRTVFVQGNIYAYKRFVDDETVLCILNNSIDATKVIFNVGQAWNTATDLLSDEVILLKNSNLELELAGNAKKILRLS